jgi:hypothetical protein
VSLVVMRMASHRPAIRQLQVSLSTLQRLDRWLFIDRKHHGIGRGTHVKANDISGPPHKIRVRALAPEFAAGQVDLLGAQEPPDILLVDLHQVPCQQRGRPVGIPSGWWLIQQGQNTLPVLRAILGVVAAITGLTQTSTPLRMRQP